MEPIKVTRSQHAVFEILSRLNGKTKQEHFNDAVDKYVTEKKNEIYKKNTLEFIERKAR